MAAGIAIWMLADQFLLHFSQPGARISSITLVFLNLIQFVGLFLGLRTKRAQNKGNLSIGRGIATGLAISASYAILASIFVAAFYLTIGSRLMENESVGFANSQPDNRVLVGAFTALFLVSALFGGLLYSTVISLALRVRPAD
jgi:hypothetical protein